jgi:hypothetical protein
MNLDIDNQIESKLYNNALEKDILTVLTPIAVELAKDLPIPEELDGLQTDVFCNIYGKQLFITIHLTGVEDAFDTLMDKGLNADIGVDDTNFLVEHPDIIFRLKCTTPDWAVRTLYSLGKIHVENFHSTSRSVYCEV